MSHELHNKFDQPSGSQELAMTDRLANLRNGNYLSLEEKKMGYTKKKKFS